MKEVFTLRWIRKRNRSIGRKREDRREIYVTFNTFNSSYFPHLLSSSLHIRKKWIDSLDDSLENRGEKREGRGKERKNYASIRENIVFSFHRGFEGLNRGQLRAIGFEWWRSAIGDAAQVVRVDERAGPRTSTRAPRILAADWIQDRFSSRQLAPRSSFLPSTGSFVARQLSLFLPFRITLLDRTS